MAYVVKKMKDFYIADIVTTVARNVHLLSTHAREDADATDQLHC